MWKLTIEDDEQKQTSLPLVHEEYAIGRAEGNVIRLTDRNVSRKHAVIRRTSNGGGGQGWVVRDLDSYNGTYVNGLRVAGEAKVAHGDVVQLGDYRLELADEQKSTDSEHARPGDHAHRPPHQRPDRLVVVVGPTPGQEFPLVGDHFTMGRAEDASISINHSSVSRLHAEIFALGTGRYEIIDKGSANGIRVNGHELKRGIFEAGDAIELGDVRLRFVGAGKIFRAGFDRSQQLSAVKGFDSVSPASLRPQAPAKGASGVGKWIGIGVVLGLIGLGAAVFVLRGRVTGDGPRPTPTAAPAAEDPGVAVLAEAKALADQGKIDEAHEKALTIPESSSARSDATFAEIEAKWADAMFERVAATEDVAEKRKLLHQVASTETVDATRRKKAAGMIQEIDPTAGDPTTTAGATTAGPGAPTPRPGGGPDDIYQSPTPSPGGKPAPAPSGSTDFREGALNAPEETMNALIRKMQAGTASEAELRVLRGLCTQLNNRSCRAAANAALKALENK